MIVLAVSLVTIPGLVYFFGREGGRVSGSPEIEGIQAWINSEPLQISQLRGKVILLDFWTYSCINCLRTLPYLNAWDEKYRKMGLVIIGVHSPEFGFEKDLERVKKAVERYHIQYAVALDSDRRTWQAYRNHFWPHKYLLDTGGNLRYEHIGEGGYEEFEKNIQELLVEGGQAMDSTLASVESEKVDFKGIKTPEIYFGKYHGQFLGNPLGLITGSGSFYREPSKLEENLFYLQGRWNVGEEFARYEGGGEGRVSIRYAAKSLNMVAGATGGSLSVEVQLDGKPLNRSQAGRDIRFDEGGRSLVTIRDTRLYYLVHDQRGYGPHTLTLKVRGQGLEAYTFTFG